ncbi:N-acetylmuramoyl-L-alanine amidase [Bernardetia sp. ABR2-2B]|uniref:N-acetylmuramoyl-L-alanine amidase family protein n=1 Tax=Bernardetia sp. ABR2-2B TaxID=3127472 RepID=UPI0030D01347
MIWGSVKLILFWLGILKKKEKIDEEIGEDSDDIIINIPVAIDDFKEEEKEPIEVLIEESEKEQEGKEKPNPNKNNLIVFRNGHGLNTSGKEAPDKTKEYTLNKWITEKTIPMLERLGYECVIANPYDYEDPNPIKALNIVIGHINRITLKAREQGKKVICIDLHCNAHQPNFPKLEFTPASGTVSFFWKRTIKDENGNKILQYSKEGEKLAIDIHEQMIKLTGLPDRAWSFNRGKAVGWNYMVLRKTICPAVTVECAFMTNSSDLEYLKSQEGQTTIAKAITRGVDNYFNN